MPCEDEPVRWHAHSEQIVVVGRALHEVICACTAREEAGDKNLGL